MLQVRKEEQIQEPDAVASNKGGFPVADDGNQADTRQEDKGQPQCRNADGVDPKRA